MTQEQRQLLVNQYRILAFLDKDNREEHERNAQILEDGHAYLYSQVFSNLSEGYPEAVGEETHQILTMFRGIDNSAKALEPEEKARLDESALRFEGFDANEPEGHYSFAWFIMNKMNLYAEHNPLNLNSHSRASLPRYRGMLAVYKQQPDKLHMGLEQLQQIAAADPIW